MKIQKRGLRYTEREKETMWCASALDGFRPTLAASGSRGLRRRDFNSYFLELSFFLSISFSVSLSLESEVLTSSTLVVVYIKWIKLHIGRLHKLPPRSEHFSPGTLRENFGSPFLSFDVEARLVPLV